MKLPRIFSSRWFLLVIVLAVGLMMFSEIKQWQQRRAVNNEIAVLKEQEASLLDTNRQLEQSINFLSTPEYQEKLARLQLNLKKEGEIVVEFPQKQNTTTSNQTEVSNQSNLSKWWEYIFIN